MAEKAPTQQLKADWLRIAETWLQLASETSRSAEVVALHVVADAHSAAPDQPPQVA